LKNPFKRKSILDDPIDKILAKMDKVEPYSEEYVLLVGNLSSLVRLQSEEQSSRVSPDTMAIVVSNLLGILIIVGYEQGHVMGSRAKDFVLRTKHS
jgi:hypothetical protein